MWDKSIFNLDSGINRKNMTHLYGIISQFHLGSEYDPPVN